MNFIITKYILENIQYQKKISMTEISTACNVSKASISRYCKRLGYEDYFDFQLSLATYRTSIDDNFYLENSEGDNFFKNYFNKIQEQINELDEGLNQQVMDNLVKLIEEHDHVVLMGQVSSCFAAISLQDNLTKMGKVVRTSQDFVEQKMLIETLEEDALVIVFSAGGKFFERIAPDVKSMARLNLPEIYFITISDDKKYSYVAETIVLGQKNDYTSWMLLTIYSDLLYLKYRKRYIDHSVS
ncbi:hypothetical protein A5881_002344 [Enterococcus termitis]|nr:hypothetical protein A5881_001338 [Enterococcus termitis]